MRYNGKKEFHMDLLVLVKRRKKRILQLADLYGVYDIRIFGSVARGEADESSDIDFLVKIKPGKSLFDLGGFVFDVKELLGVEVDAVTEDGLHPRMRERVIQEASYL